tara:strand:- start:44 stop:457 length:414 start_codon:yes stop_codon:yes gene_type:complete
MKTNYLKGQPSVRTNKYKSIYFHNFYHEDMCTIWSFFFKNVVHCKSNYKYGHEYILNSFDSYDLIIINEFTNTDEITFQQIDRFMDIINKKGELWIFCSSQNKYDLITEVLDQYKQKYYQRDLSNKDNVLYIISIEA